MAADYGHKNVLVCFWWDVFTYKLVMKAGSEAFAAYYKQVSTKGVLFTKYIFSEQFSGNTSLQSPKAMH